MSDQQQQQEKCQTGEALAEWRSSDQVENGTPSISPSYWDSDGGYEGGLKPSDLYGKYTWKIEKFSKINKRELRSDAFEIGGYKWYILIYPHGCDVSNHLSLFLCVADHDKLLPGWSHFAQLTIAVVNKDPRKSKYSDTLHRFWKKEHDWGWKKFIELPKVLNEFLEADTLIVEAQVQVIRERAERPLRYLDSRYRMELVRVYLTNVEQICRRFLEERRGKFGKLIGDKSRWPSFCTFWLGMDQTCKRRMSREKTETILKVVVKNFFIEKEVTSTLVMDSLYTGLRALELQCKGGMSKFNYMEVDKLPMPIVRVEKEMFVLVDDVLPLLERAAMEPLPSKGEKGTQNRIPDETLGKEFHKDFVECERRLTVLGRRTIEIFVLAHVFNKIEVAYQEAVSLKKQEELIREEEAAWLADIELRAKRGAVDKEKKSKKKQAKQNRNNRKSKDKGKDDKPYSIAPDRIEPDIHIVKKKDSLPIDSQVLLEKSDDVAYVSDTSDSVVCVREILPEEREASPASSTGVSGFSSVQTGTECRNSSVVDDSSSTCSSDSVHSIAITVPHTGSYHYQKNERSHSRGRNRLSKLTSHRAGWIKEEAIQPSKDVGGAVDGSQSSEAVEPPSHHSFDRQIAEDEDVSRKCGAKSVDVEASLLRRPLKIIPSLAPPKFDLKVNTAGEKTSSDRINQMHEANLAKNAASVTEMGKLAAPKFSEKPTNVELQKIENPSKQPVMVRTDKPLNAPPTQRHPPPPQSYLSAIVGGSLPASAYNHFAPSFVSTPSDWIHPNQIKPSISFGMVNHPDRLQNAPLWLDSYQRENSGMQSCDEFPHLDIINELLDDEHVDISDSGNRSFSNGLNYHFSSSRLEGSQIYLDEAFRQSYATCGASPDALGNIGSLPFLNGQIAGLTPYQWQMASAHQPLPGVAPYPNLTVDVNGCVVYRPPNGF